MSGADYYAEHGWSGCAGSAWNKLPDAVRDGWEAAARERESNEGWASYAAEQERHAETARRLELMTREARLSREATEKAVRSRVARHEIERALRAAGPPEDSMATDEDLISYQGRAEAVEIVRIMLGWTDDEAGGLHSCVGCGLELDADDRSDRCDDCTSGSAAECVCGHQKVEHVTTSPSWCLVRGGCDCHEYEAC